MQPPQFDVRASMIVGSPRAFLLDNPLMPDLEQILSAGLRYYQSAPNGDFVAFFPDYYGMYENPPTPILQISDVEIIDFQLYHDDNQLVTHYGVVGDTTAMGTQINAIDWITTNGIISLQDTITMQLLFGQAPIPGAKSSKNIYNSKTAQAFLNRYGLRPQVDQEQMLRSHTMEFLYSLFNFMKKWTDQYVSTVSLTFMPELYPGMRISMLINSGAAKPDVYEFFVVSVTHQGSRSGGFTTQAQVTAPKINGQIMDYGLDLVS
jgi:hypothetical protein